MSFSKSCEFVQSNVASQDALLAGVSLEQLAERRKMVVFITEELVSGNFEARSFCVSVERYNLSNRFQSHLEIRPDSGYFEHRF